MDNNVYTAEQFLKDWLRMCDSCENEVDRYLSTCCYECSVCDIEKYNVCTFMDEPEKLREEPEKIIDEVRKWALRHPLKTFKIRHEELSVGYFDVEAYDSNEAIEKFKEKCKEEGVDLSQMEVVRSYDSVFKDEE